MKLHRSCLATPSSIRCLVFMAKIIPFHGRFRHGVTEVRWTMADEPKASGMCSHWCTMSAVNPIFCTRNHESVHFFHEKTIRVTDLPRWLKSLQDAILKTRDCEKVDNEAASRAFSMQ